MSRETQAPGTVKSSREQRQTSFRDAVLMTDALRVVEASPSVAELLGLPRNQILGASVLELVRGQDRKTRHRLRRHVVAALRQGAHTIEVTLDRPGCDRLTLDVRAIRLGPDRWRLAHVLEDATPRQVREAECRAAVERAESANRAKSQFLASISHEIRTPMNGIIGMSKILQMSPLDGEERRCAEVISDSAGSLLHLLNNLLDLSKCEAGRLELSIAPFDLRAALQEIVALYEPLAGEKGVALHCRVDDDVPARLHGDALRLKQVLTNLVFNAIKFTHQGSVDVEVACPTIESGRAHLAFVVQDTGIGIPPEKLGAIFEPFGQGENAGKARFGGSGLGLTICRRLLELMGGAVEVESRLREGSRFSFTLELPCDPPAGRAAASSPRALASADSAPGDANTGHEKLGDENADDEEPLSYDADVLLVEDNRTNQYVGRTFLENLGCRVEVAEDGFEALQLWSKRRFDIVFMDLQMPRLDGLEATYMIRGSRGRGCNVPIVALTAHALDVQRRRCLALGMDGFLVKPVDLADFAAALEDLCPEKRHRAALPRTLQLLRKQAGLRPRPAEGGAARRCVPADSTDQRPGDDARASIPPHLGVLDDERLRQITLGRKKITETVIEHYIDDNNTYFPQLRAALEQGKLERARALAHTIKGAAANLGGERLAYLANVMQEAADASGMARCCELCPPLYMEFVALRKRLYAYLAEQPSPAPSP